jgi:hypothetical protein
MSLQFFSLALGVLYVFAVHSWRYPLVGGTRQRRFDGTNFQPRKLPENAPSPPVGCTLHAVLGGVVSEILCSGSGSVTGFLLSCIP